MPFVYRCCFFVVFAVLCNGCAGCAAVELAWYALFPDYPVFTEGQSVPLPNLKESVAVTQRADGLWRIDAAHETDAMRVVGYLQARDRMAQLDIFRHMAHGELAALIGNRTLRGSTALDTDRLHRFLGFRDNAKHLYKNLSQQERHALQAFVDGINHWIAEGHLPLEHRLLGIDTIRPWSALDSLTIYQFIMYGLSGNADREVRRLMIACAAGLDAVERIWPHDIEFAPHVLPDTDLHPDTYPPQPPVAEELRAHLPALCAQGAEDTYAPMVTAARHDTTAPTQVMAHLATVMEVLGQGWSASNNWVVAGQHTASGKPLLSNDPHLPHMNPPIMWGMDVTYADQHVAGFTLPGMHRVVFGHNGHVAWGVTTNHVDRQDLVIMRGLTDIRDGTPVAGYEVNGTFTPFEYRTERFEVKGGEPVQATVRFTRDGPLLNDLDAHATHRIPLTALRRVPIGRGRDLDAARGINHARNGAQFAQAIQLMDLGCSNWVYADVDGSIGYRAPCVTPVRHGWRGTFPVPGWNDRYRWQGIYPKEALPAATDPARGWLATANNQIVPSQRFPTTYNNDASPPNRYLRIAALLDEHVASGGLTPDTSAAMQLDTRYLHWADVQADLATTFCAEEKRHGADRVDVARSVLCQWDGEMTPDSAAATLYVLLTNALLDRALADELPGGADSEIWSHVQALVQFEVNVHWLLSRPENAAVWDDIRTPTVETRRDILEAALADAVALGTERYGYDLLTWGWGRIRPLVIRHLFATADDDTLGMLVNSDPMPIRGGAETLFKQQFLRADREHMRPIVGPVIRFTVDMSDPWSATYTLAGGESGWPRSPRYGNLLADWQTGNGRPLSPPPSDADTHVRFIPTTPAR